MGLVIHSLCLFTYLYHVLLECPCLLIVKMGICMVLEQSLVEVCLKGLNGVSMCAVVWEWCMNVCEKSVRWCLHVCENMSVRMIV